jgi:probable rRNA maturation factor
VRIAGRTLGVSNRYPRLRVIPGAVAEAFASLDGNVARFRGGCPAGELSVVFLSDAGLARIHRRFLGDPSTTDVITFAGDPAHGTAGEICISVDAALREAGKAQVALSRELTLYLVHGWLHLSGYDDRTADARRAMRAAEARALRVLADAGALPRFKLA